MVKNLKRKKQNKHIQRTNNLAGNTEADKSSRQQHQENEMFQFEQERQQRRNSRQLNSKEKPSKIEIF